MKADVPRFLAATYRDFERFEVRAHDGIKLVAYGVGPAGAPSVLIANPIGVPIVIASRLARCLARKYRVICWEQRGYGTAALHDGTVPYDYSSYVTDLLDIALYAGGRVEALVGLCSGAALAISAVSRNILRPPGLVLVCPAVRFRRAYVPSMFDSAFVPYMRMIADGNQPIAHGIMNLHACYAKAPCSEPQPDERIIEAADTISLQSITSILAYAKTLQVFSDTMLDEDIARIRQNVAVFATADDRTVSIHSVRRLCSMLSNGKLQEYANGGHFAVFTRFDFREAIVDAVDSAIARAR